MTIEMARIGESVEIDRIAIYEHPAEWSWRREEVDHHNLWLALEGEGVFEWSGRRWLFSAGSMFLLPAGLSVVARATGGLRMTNFTAHLRASGCAAEALDRLGRGGAPVRLRNFIWASHLCRYLTETFFLGPHEGRFVLGDGLGLLLRSLEFERGLPPSDPSGLVVVQIVERIRRNPAAAYSVAEMAADARLSSSQFTRRFKGVTGLSPNRFIVEERLARAESYLRETEMSVQEIAARLGYRDGYFFSRQFRKFRGVAPSRIRRRALGVAGAG